MSGRIPRLVGVVALALVVLAAVLVVRVPRDRVPPLAVGALAVDGGARGVLSTGSLRVEVAGDGVRVRRGGRVLWASDPGRSFAVAARGAVAWRDHRGYLWPDVRRRHQLADQRLERVETVGGAIVLSGSFADATAWRLTVTDGPGERATMALEAAGVDAVALVSGRGRGAGVHGFGVQAAPFDLSDRVLPLVTREQGVGRGQQPLTALADLSNHGAGGTDAMTYAAWPAYVTDDLRGVRLRPDAPGTDAFAVADTTAATRVGLEVWAPALTAEVTAADTPAALLAAAHDAPPVDTLPAWTGRGAIVGLQGGTDEVRRKLARVRAAGAEVSAVWLQDWTGRRTTSFGDRLWWTWQLDRARYPGWEALVADLGAQGIRTTTYVNPFVVDAGPKGDPTIRNLFAEARAAGHLVAGPDGRPLELDQGDFSAAMVDLSSPAARDWFADVLATQVLAAGVDGFMADFGEGPPPSARPAGGDAVALHNRWPALWAETVRDGCARAGRPDCVTWFRSASSSTARSAALLWNGDQLVDTGVDDGLGSALRGTFAAGVSGAPLVHADLGGYTSVAAVVEDHVRGPELLARWGEAAAFGVVLRTHEGNRPAVNRQVHDEAEAASFARATRLFAALAPYREEVVREALATGVPAVRHPWVAAPRSAAARRDDAFLFGSEVFVAPVLTPGARTVEVVLPPGRWRHLVTGEVVDGDRALTVAAPLGRPAAYVRDDGPWAARLSTAVADALGA